MPPINGKSVQIFRKFGAKAYNYAGKLFGINPKNANKVLPKNSIDPIIQKSNFSSNINPIEAKPSLIDTWKYNGRSLNYYKPFDFHFSPVKFANSTVKKAPYLSAETNPIARTLAPQAELETLKQMLSVVKKTGNNPKLEQTITEIIESKSGKTFSNISKKTKDIAKKHPESNPFGKSQEIKLEPEIPTQPKSSPVEIRPTSTEVKSSLKGKKTTTQNSSEAKGVQTETPHANKPEVKGQSKNLKETPSTPQGKTEGNSGLKGDNGKKAESAPKGQSSSSKGSAEKSAPKGEKSPELNRQNSAPKGGERTSSEKLPNQNTGGNKKANTGEPASQKGPNRNTPSQKNNAPAQKQNGGQNSPRSNNNSQPNKGTSGSNKNSRTTNSGANGAKKNPGAAQPNSTPAGAPNPTGAAKPSAAPASASASSSRLSKVYQGVKSRIKNTYTSVSNYVKEKIYTPLKSVFETMNEASEETAKLITPVANSSKKEIAASELKTLAKELAEKYNNSPSAKKEFAQILSSKLGTAQISRLKQLAAENVDPSTIRKMLSANLNDRNFRLLKNILKDPRFKNIDISNINDRTIGFLEQLRLDRNFKGENMSFIMTDMETSQKLYGKHPAEFLESLQENINPKQMDTMVSLLGNSYKTFLSDLSKINKRRNIRLNQLFTTKISKHNGSNSILMTSDGLNYTIDIKTGKILALEGDKHTTMLERFA